jgi:hypothetical protein
LKESGKGHFDFLPARRRTPILEHATSDAIPARPEAPIRVNPDFGARNSVLGTRDSALNAN